MPRTKIDPDKLRTEAEAIFGPAKSWEGRCYEMACAFVNKGLVKGVPVYGHWVGWIADNSIFSNRKGVPFVQHGWINLSDGSKRVVDPTRWVFEGVPPYIFLGENLGEYDEGGNKWREAMRRPPPEFNPESQRVPLLFGDKAVKDHVNSLLGGPPWYTMEMLFWLANLPFQDHGKYVVQVYEAICEAGESVAIPWDNRVRAERIAGYKFKI